MARPTKRNKEVEGRILDALRAGNYRKHAAAYAGISYDTLREWEKEFSEFSESLKKAEADAIAKNVGVVQLAGGTHWQAAAWWLERRYPEEFGRRVVKVEGKVDLGLDEVFSAIRNGTKTPLESESE